MVRRCISIEIEELCTADSINQSKFIFQADLLKWINARDDDETVAEIKPQLKSPIH